MNKIQENLALLVRLIESIPAVDSHPRSTIPYAMLNSRTARLICIPGGKRAETESRL